MTRSCLRCGVIRNVFPRLQASGMLASYSGVGAGGLLPLPNVVDGLFSSSTPHVAAAAIPPSARSTKISSGVPI
jgi:hypothetical protein